MTEEGIIKINQDLKKVITNIENTNRFLRIMVSPESLPKASGNLRIQQLASLSILKQLSSFFKNKNIKYWMDYGTLLGAVRHRGFVPWDDDVDISMTRVDYEKLKLCISEFCVNGFSYSEGDIIRVFYKDTSAQVDIFPYDSGTSTSVPIGEEYRDILNRIEEQHRRMPLNKPLNYRKGIIPDDFKSKMLNILKINILQNETVPEKAYMFSAFHTFVPRRELFSYDDIFPLKKLSYEGLEFPCPRNYKNHLMKLYGDFMTIPDEFKSHGMINTCTPLRLEEMNNLINMNSY
ncbi:MAG: phosphorylcholine transferase LicD [Oxalobacter sp.]